MKELLLQIAIGEKDAKSLTTNEMAELYNRAEHKRLEKLGILNKCQIANKDLEEKDRLRKERLERVMALIEESRNLLSIYDLELRVTKDRIKFVDRTGKVSHLEGSLIGLDRKYERLGRGKKTHQSAYYLPILKTLEELGGKARVFQILNIVKEKVERKFTKFDLEMLPSGISVRWYNTAMWARNKLKDMGYISSESPRGVWEITEKGREYIKKHDENR